MSARFNPLFPPGRNGLTWQTVEGRPDLDCRRGLSMFILKDDDSAITWDSEAMQKEQP